MNKPKALPDTKAWVTEALTNERLYKTTEPTWPDAETAEEAKDRREKLVRFLRKRSNEEQVASVLEQTGVAYCEPRHRCLSAVCPECNRAMQRFFVDESRRLLCEHYPARGQLCVVSLVLRTVEKLETEKLEGIERRVKTVLRKAGIEFALGGFDLSSNQVGWGKKSAVWAIQLWLLVPAFNRPSWERKLRALLPSTAQIRRPVLIKPFNGRLAGIAYALKTEFVSRVSYTKTKLIDGRMRTFKDTSDQPLQVAERLEVALFLSRVGLHGRLFLLGARPTRTEHGISIVKLAKKSKNSDSAQTPELPSQKPS